MDKKIIAILHKLFCFTGPMFRVIFFLLQDMEAAVAAQLNECQRATDLQEKCDFMEQCNDEVSFHFNR